ncbi:MAG: hypothetical protein JXB32_22475 [Deltaproteobacteria bacterium]|nr:hypothetical protein [Deltaproteobacteria bacterium]
MKWTMLVVLVALAGLWGGTVAVGCKKDEAKALTPCAKLVEHRIACDYQGAKSFDASAKRIFIESCDEQKDTPEAKAALACDAITDCAQFGACMDASGLN